MKTGLSYYTELQLSIIFEGNVKMSNEIKKSTSSSNSNRGITSSNSSSSTNNKKTSKSSSDSNSSKNPDDAYTGGTDWDKVGEEL
ncbi:hypothetical protein Q5M85_17455 [Paraclostridium bifermentans]|nr:hypothetical protein [Paraclostridium bifermentans]